MATILFISEILPIDTIASSVVFYRHFERLYKEGHEVHLLTDQNSYFKRDKEIPAFVHVHLLPNRKWYYPPYKAKGLLQKLRFYIYYEGIVKNIINKYKIDLLLGYIAGKFLAPFTAHVKNKSNLSLISFFHDDAQELNFFNHKDAYYNATFELLRASNRILTASNGFSQNWSQFVHKFELLYPIPGENCLSPIQKQNNTLTAGYSGTVYNEIIPSLEKLTAFFDEMNVCFKIIGNNKRINYLESRFNNIECKPLFNTSFESSNYLLSNCDFCLIAYPESIDDMPWIKTCFPSKLIQYTQIGIPTLIIAPKESALGQWCIQNAWLLYHHSYDQKIIQMLIREVLPSTQVKDQVRYYQREIFDPNKIHEQFLDVINQLAK